MYAWIIESEMLLVRRTSEYVGTERALHPSLKRGLACKSIFVDLPTSMPDRECLSIQILYMRLTTRSFASGEVKTCFAKRDSKSAVHMSGQAMFLMP